MDVPGVSVRYRPTVPLPLARPLGWRGDFEFRSRRADSQALAARTPTFARAVLSWPVATSTYATPVARPSLVVVTSRTIAPVTIFSLPVARAGGRNTEGREKLECVEQPRPHCPQ